MLVYDWSYNRNTNSILIIAPHCIHIVLSPPLNKFLLNQRFHLQFKLGMKKRCNISISNIKIITELVFMNKYCIVYTVATIWIQNYLFSYFYYQNNWTRDLYMHVSDFFLFPVTTSRKTKEHSRCAIVLLIFSLLIKREVFWTDKAR